MGQFEEALTDQTKAIELSPNNAENHRSRGVILRKLDRSEEVVIDLTKAIDLDPAFVLAYYNRGYVWAILGSKRKQRVTLTA